MMKSGHVTSTRTRWICWLGSLRDCHVVLEPLCLYWKVAIAWRPSGFQQLSHTSWSRASLSDAFQPWLLETSVAVDLSFWNFSQFSQFYLRKACRFIYQKETSLWTHRFQLSAARIMCTVCAVRLPLQIGYHFNHANYLPIKIRLRKSITLFINLHGKHNIPTYIHIFISFK